MFHVLLSLTRGERHGYLIMKEVEERTGGAVGRLPAAALPSADPERLVHVWSTDRRTGMDSGRSSLPDVEAVVSHSFAVGRLGGANTALGATIPIVGREHAIVGVMAESFVFPLPVTQVWLPYVFDPAGHRRLAIEVSITGG